MSGAADPRNADATAGRGSPAARGGGTARLRLRLDPLRLLVSPGLWAAAWYLLAYIFGAWILFSIAFTATVTAAVFAITLAGIPLLVAAAAVLRGCASVERWRLRPVFAEPVRGGYRATARPGLLAQVGARWKDRATWRDTAYIIGLWPVFFLLDTVVFCVWVTLLAGVTLPVWYWAPKSDFDNGTTAHGVQLGYFPNGPHGHGAAGLWVGSLPTALLAAAGFLVVFLLFNYVLVATARAHARVARAMLRPPADPLAEAKRVLAGPGPLSPLIPNGGRKMHGQAS